VDFNKLFSNPSEFLKDVVAPYLPNEPVGFVGERKALSLLFFSVFVNLYALVALILYGSGENGALFAALSCCYAIGFFAVASGWFWGRWFFVGLAYSGLTMALWSIVISKQIDGFIVFYGALHGISALCLQGQLMEKTYEGQSGWKEQLQIDEQTAKKIGTTVVRVASSLPAVLALLLAPRETDQLLVFSAGAFLLSMYFLIKGRSLGLVLIPVGIIALITHLFTAHGFDAAQIDDEFLIGNHTFTLSMLSSKAYHLIAIGFSGWALFPWAKKIFTHLLGK